MLNFSLPNPKYISLRIGPSDRLHAGPMYIAQFFRI